MNAGQLMIMSTMPHFICAYGGGISVCIYIYVCVFVCVCPVPMTAVTYATEVKKIK